MIPIIQIQSGETPIERAYSVSMTIHSFKGRRNVEVHLFRPNWKEEEANFDATSLFGDPIMEDVKPNPDKDKKIILEAFTSDERDQVIDYLKAHYSSRLESIASSPIQFPIPSGMPPLSSIFEGKDIGLIKFEKITHFNLPFPLRGLYNLNEHAPLVEPGEHK